MQAVAHRETQRVVLQLGEWTAVSAADDPRLRSISLRGDAASQRIAEGLSRRLEIEESFHGLRIEATSFVGRVDIGPLRVVIVPKLESAPLTDLFRYAYGLRDLQLQQHTSTPTAVSGFQDLLVAMLCAEISELLQRGLSRQYVPLEAVLGSPRGRIIVGAYARQGPARTQLPCRFFDRRADWHVNRVLLAGLRLGRQVAGDPTLRRHVHQLATMFPDVEAIPALTAAHIDHAETALTRLTEANRPALTLVRLLYESAGASLEGGAGGVRTRGFLFDMNLFFQHLVSRFLRENLVGARIDDQSKLRRIYTYAPAANPRQRPAPVPRPDFALSRAGSPRVFLDAKYRDVWNRGYSAEWLYQLSVYALASPARASILLYSTVDLQAREERLEIHDPLATDGVAIRGVIIRPVPLRAMAQLLGNGPDQAEGRRALAASLVAP